MKGNQSPLSDHYDGKRFHNRQSPPHNLWKVLKWMAKRRSKPVHTKRTVSPLVEIDARPPPHEMWVTFINHSTFLIQWAGLNILTDPLFSKRASPFRWIGPKRSHPPGIAFHNLPPIDLVLISHNHYDHMDLPTLVRLHRRDRPRFIVPLGNARTLEGAGIDGVVELDWWNETVIGDDASVVLVPVQHWSGRSLLDRRRALWGGFFIRRGPAAAFFAGDTGYGAHFAMIRERLGSPDLSLLPIGAYEPRWFMKDQHINPDEAVRAHLDLGSRLSVGMHFGTFRLTDEGIGDPVAALASSRLARGVPDEAFRALHNGLTVRLRSSAGR